MRLILLESQIDIILKSLELYSDQTDKKQLLYATYESIQEQKISQRKSCYKNVTYYLPRYN